MSHLFLTIRKTDYLNNSIGVRAVAAEAIKQWEPNRMIVMKVSLGKDQAIWLTRKYPNIIYWDETSNTTPSSLLLANPTTTEFIFISDSLQDNWLQTALKNGWRFTPSLTFQPNVSIVKWKRPG